MSEVPRCKRPRDPNQLAYQIVMESTGQGDPFPLPEKKLKNPAAVALGRLGEMKGGQTRAAALSQKKRSVIAAKAGKSRWSKAKR